jgi:hypothetical protein
MKVSRIRDEIIPKIRQSECVFCVFSVAEGALEDAVLPVLHPVNPPPVEFSPESNYSRLIYL